MFQLKLLRLRSGMARGGTQGDIIPPPLQKKTVYQGFLREKSKFRAQTITIRIQLAGPLATMSNAICNIIFTLKDFQSLLFNQINPCLGGSGSSVSGLWQNVVLPTLVPSLLVNCGTLFTFCWIFLEEKICYSESRSLHTLMISYTARNLILYM